MSEVPVSTCLEFKGSVRRPLGYAAVLFFIAWVEFNSGRRENSVPNLDFLLAGAISLVATALIAQALLRTSRLILSEDGIAIVSGSSATRYLWSDCEVFGIRRSHLIRYIVITFSTSYKGGGSEGAIFNRYSASTEEIVAALLTWQKLYGPRA
jgi:hypothetical protein